MQVVVIDGCPHAESARRLLEETVADLGLSGTPVQTRVVATEQEAIALAFTGSPSFFADGADLFPDDAGRPGVSCRVYRTERGLAGLPDRHALAAALSRASGSE